MLALPSKATPPMLTDAESASAVPAVVAVAALPVVF